MLKVLKVLKKPCEPAENSTKRSVGFPPQGGGSSSGGDGGSCGGGDGHDGGVVLLLYGLVLLLHGVVLLLLPSDQWEPTISDLVFPQRMKTQVQNRSVYLGSKYVKPN